MSLRVRQEQVLLLVFLFFLDLIYAVRAYPMSKESFGVLFDILFDVTPVTPVITDFLAPGAHGNHAFQGLLSAAQ
jgi:hypothetical protein